MGIIWESSHEVSIVWKTGLNIELMHTFNEKIIKILFCQHHNDLFTYCVQQNLNTTHQSWFEHAKLTTVSKFGDLIALIRPDHQRAAVSCTYHLSHLLITITNLSKDVIPQPFVCISKHVCISCFLPGQLSVWWCAGEWCRSSSGWFLHPWVHSLEKTNVQSYCITPTQGGKNNKTWLCPN